MILRFITTAANLHVPKEIFVRIWHAFLFIILALANACMPVATRPRNIQEAFPQWNRDPQKGIFVIEGTPDADVVIYDEAGRPVATFYVEGANPRVRINGRFIPRRVVWSLPIGRYRAEVFPFYYVDSLLWGRQRIDLRPRSLSFRVDDDPLDAYDRSGFDHGYGGGFGTGRSWGWIARIHTGHIPRSLRGGIIYDFRSNLFGGY